MGHSPAGAPWPVCGPHEGMRSLGLSSLVSMLSAPATVPRMRNIDRVGRSGRARPSMAPGVAEDSGSEPAISQTLPSSFTRPSLTAKPPPTTESHPQTYNSGLFSAQKQCSAEHLTHPLYHSARGRGQGRHRNMTKERRAPFPRASGPPRLPTCLPWATPCSSPSPPGWCGIGHTRPAECSGSPRPPSAWRPGPEGRV